MAYTHNSLLTEPCLFMFLRTWGINRFNLSSLQLTDSCAEVERFTAKAADHSDSLSSRADVNFLGKAPIYVTDFLQHWAFR